MICCHELPFGAADGEEKFRFWRGGNCNAVTGIPETSDAVIG
jgi:hypothetical protein